LTGFHWMTFLLLSPALAQNTATFVDASYTPPAVPQVAPGQVVTLYFRGLRPNLTAAQVAARLWHDGKYIDMPLFSLRQQDECAPGQGGSPDCTLTALRVQIPFELNTVTVAAGTVPQGYPAPAEEFVLEVDGVASRRFRLSPLADNAHVVTTCGVAGETFPTGECVRAAYHADGKRVDPNTPARRGDGVVVYAYGLGPTFPSAETGRGAPRDARIPESGRRRVWLTLLDQPLNASGSIPRGYHPQADDGNRLPADFVGLAPGQVGLYQVNLRIPDWFRPVLPCGPEVRSNALLLVTTWQGSETVPLCVAQ
jgi:uncharacterized protein (TIGR03437 family)